VKLYEMAAEYAAIQEAAERGDDVGEALAKLEDGLETKCVAIVHVLANLDADAEACGKEETRLAVKRKSAEHQVERLRSYIRTCMLAAGITKIKGPTVSITLSPGQDKVDVYDLGALEAAAPELVTTTTTRAADKRGVLARYKGDGECLPGTRIEPTTTLRVR
jgi:Siphovirus Gp157